MITVVPLGDSLTAGYNGVNNIGGYRPILFNTLTSQGIQIQYQGVFDDGSSPTLTAENQGMEAGFSGFGAQDIANNLGGDVHSIYSGYSNLDGYWFTGGHFTGHGPLSPNIVLLMIGTNDAGYGLSVLETGTNNILAWFAANLPQTEVIAAVPPPAANGYDVSELETEDAWLSSIVSSTYTEDRVAEVLPGFLNTDGSVSASLIGPDGVHPTQQGYGVISNAFDSAIVASVAVPEPTSLSLLAVGGVAMLRRRVRRQSLP